VIPEQEEKGHKIQRTSECASSGKREEGDGKTGIRPLTGAAWNARKSWERAAKRTLWGYSAKRRDKKKKTEKRVRSWARHPEWRSRRTLKNSINAREHYPQVGGDGKSGSASLKNLVLCRQGKNQ